MSLPQRSGADGTEVNALSNQFYGTQQLYDMMSEVFSADFEDLVIKAAQPGLSKYWVNKVAVLQDASHNDFDIVVEFIEKINTLSISLNEYLFELAENKNVSDDFKQLVGLIIHDFVGSHGLVDLGSILFNASNKTDQVRSGVISEHEYRKRFLFEMIATRNSLVSFFNVLPRFSLW